MISCNSKSPNFFSKVSSFEETTHLSPSKLEPTPDPKSAASPHMRVNTPTNVPDVAEPTRKIRPRIQGTFGSQVI